MLPRSAIDSVFASRLPPCQTLMLMFADVFAFYCCAIIID